MYTKTTPNPEQNPTTPRTYQADDRRRNMDTRMTWRTDAEAARATTNPHHDDAGDAASALWECYNG